MDPAPCRPFDRSRAGMNIGEGAGILMLEDLERARRRGAHIYAELAGYSASCEAFHPTAPEPEGRAVGAMVRGALGDARPAGRRRRSHQRARHRDAAERSRRSARLPRVFGDRAARMPVTSIKSMIGHCLGAAGAVEAAVTALTVARGVIPPTIHHTETDPDCARRHRRQYRARAAGALRRVDVAGFGGNDAAIVITAV